MFGLAWDSGNNISGGAGTGWVGEVDNFSLLPLASTVTDEVYKVLNPQGTWLLGTKKKAGLYESNGTTWQFLGVELSKATTGEITAGTETAVRRHSPADIVSYIDQHGLYDYVVTANDWADLVQALESGSYQTVFIPNGTYTCTDNEASPLVVHANVTKIDGQSMDSVIINANCSVNTSITTVTRFSSYKTICSNIQIQNIANSSYGFWGETSSLTSDSKNKTQLINCRVYGISFPAVGFRNINGINCEAENPSSVGSVGAGKGFWICNNLIGCHTTYISWGFSASEGMTNCSAAKFTEGFQGNNIDGCHAKGGTTAFSACTNLSYNNTIANVTNNYVSCSFNSTYKDNTDNTKELTHDYSNISTGTEREVTWQDKDGTVALLDVENAGSLQSSNIATRGFDRLNPDTMGEVSAVASTQTFSHSVKSGESLFRFWAGGKYYEKTTTQSVTFTNTTGTYYFYYDTDGVLQSTPNSSMTEAIFLVSAMCGIVYYNKEEGTVWIGKDEKHGIIMTPADHFLTHMTLKFRNSQGGNITGLTDGGSTYTNIGVGVYHDEDIVNVAMLSTAHKFMYRDGANGGWKLHSNTADNKIALMNGANAVWNEWTGTTWQLTDCASSTDYVIGYVLKTNLDGEAGLVKLIGHNAYPNRGQAREALFENIDTLYLEGLSSSECQFQFAYIYKRDGTLEDDGNGETYIDLRNYQSSGSSISSVSHNTLTGLNTGDYQHLTASELSALQAQASVYAYLNSSSSVTCTTSGTYYPIAGTFTNDFVNFIFDTDHIEYTGTVTQKFEIDWHASLSAESNGTTVQVTVAKNGTNQTAQRMGVYCKTAGETFTVSGTIVLELAEDDEVQLVVSSDDAGGDITFAHFTTTIARFLR